MLLKGHSKAVLSLTSFRNELLASGSEDCSVRFWDIRTGKRAIRKLTCPSSVPALSHGKTVHEWVVASGNSLLIFDLRNETKVIVSEFITALSTRDEINDIDFMELENDNINSEQDMEYFFDNCNYRLSVADDEGDIYVSTNKDSYTTHPCHEGSIATSSRFLNSKFLVSGGLDDSVVISNWVDGNIAYKYHVDKLQPFNPPHVYAIDTLKLSRNQIRPFVAAYGDGSVGLFNPSLGRSKKGIQWGKVFNSSVRLEEVHLSSTCCVRFIDEEKIGTAGNDKTITILKVSEEMSKLEVIHRYGVNEKPNSICFQNDNVFIGDVSVDVTMFPWI